jgi:tetratricopeptide (TPR) repeat protein
MQIDTQQARTYLDEALQNPNNIQDILTHATLLTRNADWYYKQHDYSKAEEYAQQACDLVQSFGDLIIAADALIVLGRIEYALQHYETGSQHFVAGLDMLERLGSHEELSDESVNYAQLLEELGHEREAYIHYRRAFQSRQKLGK